MYTTLLLVNEINQYSVPKEMFGNEIGQTNGLTQ